MLRVLAVVMYLSIGMGVFVSYVPVDDLEEGQGGAVMFGIVMWPMFPVADALNRMGVGDVD